MGLHDAAIIYRDGLGAAADPTYLWQRIQLRGDGRAQTRLQGWSKIGVIGRAHGFSEACRMYIAWFAA